jgi:hypothetical protein
VAMQHWSPEIKNFKVVRALKRLVWKLWKKKKDESSLTWERFELGVDAPLTPCRSRPPSQNRTS